MNFLDEFRCIFSCIFNLYYAYDIFKDVLAVQLVKSYQSLNEKKEIVKATENFVNTS